MITLLTEPEQSPGAVEAAGEMFGQAIRRRSRHVRQVIDCFRSRRGSRAVPQPAANWRHQIR
jgi:hypothetical protein